MKYQYFCQRCKKKYNWDHQLAERFRYCLDCREFIRKARQRERNRKRLTI